MKPLPISSMDQPKLVLEYNPKFSLDQLNLVWTLLAIDHFDGNKSMACESLGITVKTLYNRMVNAGIDHVGQRWTKGLASRYLAGV